MVWWAIFIVIVVAAVVWLRGTPKPRKDPPGPRAGGVGTAAVGAVYGLLNEEKRRAVEIILEEKAGARRPEYPDGRPTTGPDDDEAASH